MGISRRLAVIVFPTVIVSPATMTKPARISYADVLRTMKAIKASGITDARVIVRPDCGEIEVVIAAEATMRSVVNPLDEWTDDDI